MPAALAVRRWAEKLQLRKPSLFDAALGGLCVISSAHLFELLRIEGVPTEIALSEEHCFLLHRGLVLDVTATQYDHPKRVLYTRHEDVTLPAWKHVKICSSLPELQEYLVSVEWCPTQWPNNHWDQEFIDSWKR